MYNLLDRLVGHKSKDDVADTNRDAEAGHDGRVLGNQLVALEVAQHPDSDDRDI